MKAISVAGSRSLAVLAALAALASGASGAGCGGAPPSKGGVPIAVPTKAPAVNVAAPAPVVPVPETLVFDAGRFGLTMLADGWTWKVLRRNVTRFDWSGRPPGGEREVLYSFYMDKLDEVSTRLLPQLVGSAAANLSEVEPCRPIEQPAEVVRAAGVDRIVTVCFEPSTFYGKEHHYGVMHGIVRNGALTLAVVLSKDHAGAVFIPALLGARGAR